jgi:hypothetical protein
MEFLLLDTQWILTNDSSDFKSVNITGSDGFWELQSDSMIHTGHCYQWETYHKILFISSDSLVIQPYNREWGRENKSDRLHPTEIIYRFKRLNSLDENFHVYSKKTLHLTKPKPH